MNAIPKLLSKTKLMRGYRCAKCIYLTVHHPELEPPVTPDLQALFDQGNQVGTLAREYFPGGTLVDNVPWDFTGALNKTRELLASGVETIYEAAFEYAGCYARVDIIHYARATKRWRIYEVKSTTKVKPEHIDDVGLQTWIMAKSGLPIEQINILHLNTDCRFPDLSNLFKEQDVTAEIRNQYLSVQPKVRTIYQTLRETSIPDVDIGPHCLAPTPCSFVDHCWSAKNIPPLSIFNLPGLRERKWQLYQAGITDLNDERLTELNELQARIIAVCKSGERFVDKPGVAAAMADWQFPLIFLDFETINPAIPRFDGCGPYQQVPFQFSVHRLESLNSELLHEEFLYTQKDDPRPTLIPALLAACGTQGTIIAYFSKFEATRIQEMANQFPLYRAALEALLPRIVDPLEIVRAHIYDAGFHGSFSLKKVAPALLGDVHSYADMLVANGSAAQRAYEELISEMTPENKKNELHAAMLAYCKKDTEVMVELVKWLYSQK